VFEPHHPTREVVMKGRTRIAAGMAALALAATAGVGTATADDRRDDDGRAFAATLSGFEEVPAISTEGRGAFRAWLRHDELRWRLTYAGLEGGDVQQAHIHFAQPGVNGGVVAFLCSNLPDAPRGVQPCPDAPAEIRGRIGADDIVGPAEQGIERGELAAFVGALRAGLTYANVHTERFPNGEIRGQIQPRDHHADGRSGDDTAAGAGTTAADGVAATAGG
jgi:hypothetical protein